MDIEHKLDLIQQIHREQEENERLINSNLKQRNYNRENYTPGIYDYRGHGRNFSEEQDLQGAWFASFRLRLLLAVLLFLCLFTMDKKEIEIGGIGSVEIIDYIEKNMDIKELADLHF